MPSTTFSHSNSAQVSLSGFEQRVPLPANPNSNQLASFHRAEMVAVVPLVFGTATYTVPVPKNAILTIFQLVATTTFSGGTSPAIKAGSTAAAADLLASVAVTATFSSVALSSVLVGSADSQTVFVTITGAPTAGAGYLLIKYINPSALLNGITD